MTSAGPHAVSSVTGTHNDAFCYDANGNMLSGLDEHGDGRSVAWTAFNKPQRIVKGSNTVELAYGPNRARTKRVDISATGTTTTHYAGGKLFEAVESGGHWQQKHYVGDFAVVTKTVTTGLSETHYLLTDHLGSVDTVMNASGVVVERLSFDPWGKRRQINWVPLTDPAGHVPLVTPRGYTGHEQLDPVGLVHMNGRVYNPEIARFLSADPFVQHPFNGQNLNRYSYVVNNPLSYTDPSGFFYIGDDVGYNSDTGSYSSDPNDYSGWSGYDGNSGYSGGNGGGDYAGDHGSSGKSTGGTSTGSNTSVLAPPANSLTGLEGSPEAQPSLQAGAQAPATGPYGGNGMQGSPEVAANKDYPGNVVDYMGSPKFEVATTPAVAAPAAVAVGEGVFAGWLRAAATRVSAAVAAAATTAATATVAIAGGLVLAMTTEVANGENPDGVVEATGSGHVSDETKTVPTVHGNSARSQRETEVYLLINRSTGVTDKIGITSNPKGRYSQRYLDINNVDYVPEATYRSRYPALIHENIRLFHHWIENGDLPRLNKTFR